ncbi:MULTISPECIES: helix-turn-helix domain-containing protein [unclassified Achromobacter]|uniref:helix-turn-helix domain-containing protein n=1 Tax=unclassified Achromobacter TaxID=2626865 RepID=UPI000B519386|nr:MULTISPECIES: helix-turn-helix domain-containing protein [unclassified Achromobacter]OWT80451.1 AraC family transcriptional regulator [Achromobacter sp. HZ34]OWT82334.1 AraC family transcriptional regulator [Achromobacter sp. HZ28]
MAALPQAEPFPTFETSDFSGAGTFYFDLVRLQDRNDIPRGFLHRHNYYHMLWMTRAQGSHLLDFEQFEVRDHAVFFLTPGQVHAWTSKVAPRGYVLNISTEFFARMFPRADDVAKFPFFHLTHGSPALYLTREQHDDMLPLLHQIERETLERDTGCFDIVRSYLLILLTRLRRLYPVSEPETGAGPSHTLTRRLSLLIEERYLEFSSMGQYADALCVSERQLNDAVKRTVGQTAGQLVQARIALEAKRLLTNTAKGISEIAFQLNFEDPAYFARFFKKHSGSTPGDFRRKYSDPIE